MLNLQVGIGDPYSNLYRVVDLALNQSRQTLVSPIYTSVPSVALLRKYRGQICNLALLTQWSFLVPLIGGIGNNPLIGSIYHLYNTYILPIG